MPKVSVAMSVYNGEKHLAESIQSVLNQTFKDFEFIICDDASTDNSIDIINQYISKDNRIILIRNEVNEGLASSLNSCINKSKGEYIARMDADDLSVEDRFEKQVLHLENNPQTAFVCGGVYLFDDNGTWGKRNSSRSLTKENIFKYQPIAHPTTMIRKSVLELVQGYTVASYTRRGQDFDLWCKIYSLGLKGEKLKGYVLYYREDKTAYKKRLFKYRLDSYKMKKMWRRSLNLPIYYELFAYKPLVAGLTPKFVLEKYHKKKFKKNI
ncbi:glycosyltransferase family 2 protein [Halobacillus sp. H74]|uniref:glycosyltransferase family 2 protein n=1 Tax=Halobacillus sp. H74 TaxID=3457436 RepID=UPI003FCE6BF8